MIYIGLQILLMLAGLVTGRAAIKTSRTAQGAMGWVVFLLAFPLLALPAFALFGGVSRLRAKPESRHLPRPGDGMAPGRLSMLVPMTLTAPQPGNRIRLLVDGTQTFPAMFAAIDAAEHEICLQSYILRSDTLGRDFHARLIAAADRGVRVRVLCDLVGSMMLSREYVRSLRAHDIAFYRIPGPHRALGRIGLNFRNHRKALIVDGRIGFTGGINIGDEYLDGGRAFDSWRDTHVQIEGPMVAQLYHLFVADWQAVTGEKLPPMATPEPIAGNGVSGLVTGHGPTDETERGSLLLCALVNMAQRRLWIATPYLVPHTDLMTALQLARLRGVDVKFLIPRESDNLLAWYASRGYAHNQTRLGMEVYEYLPGFMHSKVILIDDDVSAVGTVNFDIRSVLLNYEQTALVEDRDFAAQVEAMFEADFARSRPMSQPASWHIRWFAPMARLFGPLL